MNDMIKGEDSNIMREVIKSANIKITLEQWPCAVAILGIGATYAFVTWLENKSQEDKNAA